MVVGGGGSGGTGPNGYNAGSGGGAGGYRAGICGPAAVQATTLAVCGNTPYPITIGGGGVAGVPSC